MRRWNVTVIKGKLTVGKFKSSRLLYSVVVNAIIVIFSSPCELMHWHSSSVNVHREVDPKSNMVALVSDWLTHFQLLKNRSRDLLQT